MAEIKKLEESHAAEMRKADEDHKRELEELMTRLRDSLPGDEVIRLRAELEAAATERDELQESKNTAYRSLVQIEDELADARRRVSELEAKLRQQDGGQAGALSTIGSELASMQEEIREAGNRFVYLSKAAGARELQEVWCGSMLQQVEGDSTLQVWRREGGRRKLCRV